MFNNNNYLPDLNHYPPTGQQRLSTNTVTVSPAAPRFEQPRQLPPPAMPPVSSFGHHGNFRFLSPTQVTAVPTWMPAASIVGTQSAPGMGTSWQHSVPMTMPWANHSVPHFSAEVVSVASLPVYTTPVGVMSRTIQMQTTPKSSVRCLRLKRRFQPCSLDDPDSPTSKRYLSEKMAHWFKKLQIGPSQGENDHHSLGGTSGQQGGPSMLDNGWQRFHEVEKRLGEDVDDGDLEMGAAPGQSVTNGVVRSGATAATASFSSGHGGTTSRTMKNGALLKIPEELKKEVQNPEPVLPAQIMKTITNPCMDLVLWKPPEAIITTYLSPEASSLPTSDSSHSSIACSSGSSSSSISSCPRTTAGNSPSGSSAQQQQSLLQGGVSGGSSGAFGSFFSSSSGMTQANGSKTSMDSMDFFDYMDDDMDL